MKLILYQATIAITKIDFGPGPFRCQIELGHLDFAVARTDLQTWFGSAQEWSWRTLAESKSAQPTRAVW